jgi:uncharacterized protein DUF7033
MFMSDSEFQNVVGVSIETAFDTPQRRYGLTQLLRIAGFRPRFESSLPVALHYGTAEPPSALVWIPADDESSWASGSPRLTLVQGTAVLHFGKAPQSLWQENRLTFDIARAAYYFLSLESEKAIATRDQHGRVAGAESVLGRARLLNDPPVDGYADLLSQRLKQSVFERRMSTRWPDGKRFAVALTHDVDTPERGGRTLQSLRAVFRDGIWIKRQAYWRLRAAFKNEGLGWNFAQSTTRRPEWDFEHWCALESAHGFRSAFYLSMVDRRAGHECDVTYNASLQRYRRLMRRLDHEGWEVGLHAAYSTWREEPAVTRQVERFRQLSGRPAWGLRHHYLHLDPTSPLDTLAAHARAGLLYDTTIGFNDTPGFRAGTALPYETPDRPGQTARRFIEIPMTLADMHLPPRDIERAKQTVLDHLECVRKLGGCGVLNWHVGHWHSHPGWRESYKAACEWLRNCPDAWVATPAEIAMWWLNQKIDHPGVAIEKAG